MYFIILICSCTLSFFISLALRIFLEPRAFICSFSLIRLLFYFGILDFKNSKRSEKFSQLTKQVGKNDKKIHS